jgi:hypothetical protein
MEANNNLDLSELGRALGNYIHYEGFGSAVNLAHVSKVSISTIYAIIRGGSFPKPETVEKLVMVCPSEESWTRERFLEIYNTIAAERGKPTVSIDLDQSPIQGTGTGLNPS